MAKVIPIGSPVNEAERRTIAHLRDNLPDSYILLHNFEVERDGELFEVDLAVIAPHAVYLVDTKGTRGLIDVYGSKWYPEGRQPYTSPLAKLRGHAKSLKGLITASQPGRRELEDIGVLAAVVLAAPDAVLQDSGGRDRPRVTTLAKSAAFFQNSAAVPARFSKNISRFHKMVLKALQAVAKPRSGPLRFGSWEVVEKLGGTDAYTEYRAHNAFAGSRSGSVLLRAYTADHLAPPAERKKERARIANAYNALNNMPGHPGIMTVRDFFPTEHEDRYILVTEDVAGQALRLHIDKPNLALTVDQKLRVAADLLDALSHAHQHEVVHRNLTPSTMLLGAQGRLRLIGFDFARAGTNRSLTIAHEIVDELEPLYQAPEVYRDPAKASPASDVFAAGLVLYELFVGERAFDGPTEVFDHEAKFASKPSQAGVVPPALDEWLQRLCAFEPGDRPTAAAAAEQLAALLEPPGTGGSDLTAPEFVERYLVQHDDELRPLLEVLGDEETEWLEFKAALIPPPDREGANDNDGRWAVTKAAVALANSVGGAVLLGVDDDGRPAPLVDSDPKGYFEKQGWDVFARKVLDAGLFREGGWKTKKRGKWELDVSTFKTHVKTVRATLDGEPVVVLVVTPVGPPGPLLTATNTREGKTSRTLFVRRKGDVGVVDKLDEAAVETWLQNRQLTSPRFAQLLEATLELASRPSEPPPPPPTDYSKLESGSTLTHKYVVQERLGRPGSFGVVYKVIDTLGDVTRAVKLILRDRHSTLDRLKKEYRTLLRIPPHQRVVKVVDADVMPNGGPPFIVCEYIAGLDVGEMIDQGLFSPSDALELARQVADGLVHLHRHGVYHCDIKPRNLIWTQDGARIIDFNVSVLADTGNGHGGGSKRYLPPDLDLSKPPQPSDLADRDLFALGVTVYEAVTGTYPWEATVPPPGQKAADPREMSGLADLAPELVETMLKALSSKRADRFASATELLAALENVAQARRAASTATPTSSWSVSGLDDGGTIPPNTNPFVGHLLTVYSQSQQSNAGTRGLDALGEQTYVETALDRELEPAVLTGEFRLVIITGNAGDGKTAFLQRFEQSAEDQQAEFDEPLPNGRRFRLQGRSFVTNYDGSQDEGEQSSDEVLDDFFGPFAGDAADSWPTDEVRLIAINEGRLVDFLAGAQAKFPLLQRVVTGGLVTGVPEQGVAVVNLNLRSVVADQLGFEDDPRGADDSIFARLMRRMTAEPFWAPCEACDLRDRCYARHNAKTFQDGTAGPKVVERLKTLYTLTHLRGRLHITLRDLRSALAFMLVGTRDCREIHELYRSADRDAIAQGFYFNSWMGGDGENADRLLDLLKDVDVGVGGDPRLDRRIDFVSPAADRSLFAFEDRATYDRDVLRRLFDDLPRDFSGRPSQHRASAHQRYVAMARRRSFFERRDAGWRQMLPYRAGERMLELVRGEPSPGILHGEVLPKIIRAINRGEGLSDPDRLGGKLALQVRHVERGTIRSYRVFPVDRFSLRRLDAASAARFVEHMPTGLVLTYQGAAGNEAELRIDLDVFEMLERLNEGYRPSVEEEQGFYLSLAVFKNVLGSEPYQEVLLTTTGHDFYRVERHGDGRLEMTELGMGAV
ncbi:MAG TPA: protein kinase [Polyangiaceae bacterium LLY-WYZ-15_(1-7)]|nr:hypothetical protein [Sandaracinus sp.]HJL02365.1 protein kinase [Polyangiaceae bacterium LLY-WYZ-15_(1-7)]HJL11655.1 protein kinase [Polyangiaceae bacterium LLY-WYZ-15_(1-7)]HJL32111.1 protein kinase [Polyangiaceae bacterium LLY-WYZ-15_(1-7)]